MGQLLSKGLLVAAATGAQAWAALAALWRALLPEGAPTYRPEAHYMRGPGPKWRAKHAAFHSDIDMGMRP